MGDDTSLAELKKLIADLASEVSSIKVDQARLHVAVNNVQSNRIFADSKDKGVVGGSGGGGLPLASHKLCFPSYDGSTDPLAWLHRCDQFFHASRTAEDKVWYAAFYMDGDAQSWYFRLERNQGVPLLRPHHQTLRAAGV
jgi:hypothetical protein